MKPLPAAAALFVVAAQPAGAQEVPTIDTEDASLGSASVDEGRFHPLLAVDLRNGDFARGDYDDDAADLARVPVHIQLGFTLALGQNKSGEADSFLVFNSSNGFHGPSADEQAAPRAWYESNNALAVIVSPTKDLWTGLAYTIKTSPNGVSPTTHELSFTTAWQGKSGLGALQPSMAVTWRPKGGDGVYTQIGIEPSIPLVRRDEGPELSFPARLGVGWSGFYQDGTGNLTHGSAGIAYVHPFVAGGAKWWLRAELLALMRDNTLRRLSVSDAEQDAVLPLGALSLQLAF